jgi:SAM-dependent methyltransferase
MSSNSDNRHLSQTEKAREYPPRPTIAPRERDDLYYTLLAGAAKTKLLESWYDLRLPALLAERGPLTAAEIGDSLGLHLKRAGKWLVLLARIGLIEQAQGRFQNSEAGIAMFWAKDGRENYFMKDQMEYCRWVNALDFVEVLRGMALPEAVRWPPRTKEAAAHLELWMTVTANEAITALEAGTDWSKTSTLLDVGGGDATIACALVRKFEHLHVTVFNLPASAELARARVAREKLESRVSVVVGDFIKDELPKGFDRVMFSRVLADWEPSVTQMLLKKAYAALRTGGSIVISEPLDDSNRDLAVSWEYRYTFYDDFGVQTYKSRAQYEAQLKVAGCSSFDFNDRIDDTLYGVLTAR